jgi:Protein of unknown function (DUF1236)
MSTNKLMMAVATAALIAGSSTVFAQQQGGAPGGAPSGQNRSGQTTGQAVPGGATHNGAAETKGGRNAAEERGESKSNRAGEAQPNRRETTGQAAPQKERSQQNERRESQSNERRENRSEQNKAQDRAGEDRRLDQNRRSDERNVDRNRKTEQRNNVNERERATEERGNGRENERDRTTTGQGAAGSRASVNLTPEKRTQMHEVFVQERSAPRVDRVDFSVSVGTRVPRSVRFVPVPRTIVEIEPSWRGYDYFLVGDQIVIVDPRSLEIVAIVDA